MGLLELEILGAANKIISEKDKKYYIIHDISSNFKLLQYLFKIEGISSIRNLIKFWLLNIITIIIPIAIKIFISY